MRVAILYNEPGPDADAADLDVFAQVDAVRHALVQSGHQWISIGCNLDLAALSERLAAANIDCAFNLVEALGGTDRLSCIVPVLLESLSIPYTGSRAQTMLSTVDKVVVKQRLVASGIPTPHWLTTEDDSPAFKPGKYIVKARFEHASIGMDDSAVVHLTEARGVKNVIRQRERQTGQQMFAEAFIEGREFNISVLSDERGHGRALAPAEIDFSAFPAGKPRIVGYDAKWSESSFEFNATPRVFTFPDSDGTLLNRLKMLSERVWQTFFLAGYARVDFRVDQAGAPFVLEMNTNPCISPDAGFAAALSASGVSFERSIEAILDAAFRPQSVGHPSLEGQAYDLGHA